MDIETFVGYASGQTYSNALINRVRPATPEVVSQIQELERIQHAIREEVRKLFPATLSWNYETSWRYNLDALRRIWEDPRGEWDKCAETAIKTTGGFHTGVCIHVLKQLGKTF